MVKVGDKIRVLEHDNPMECPVGSIGTVVKDCGDGDVTATMDHGGDFDWFLSADEYEVIGKDDPETDYAEQAAWHGIKITLSVGDMSITYDGTN